MIYSQRRPALIFQNHVFHFPGTPGKFPVIIIKIHTPETHQGSLVRIASHGGRVHSYVPVFQRFRVPAAIQIVRMYGNHLCFYGFAFIYRGHFTGRRADKVIGQVYLNQLSGGFVHHRYRAAALGRQFLPALVCAGAGGSFRQ